ncbi:MAG TPA: response regulator, partial [Gemmatimonadales bacterium]
MSAVTRVLLAEDEANLGLILETFLRGRGHEVTRVADGRAALDAARACTFDVALLDVVMPEMNGLEVLGALAEVPFAPEAIVVTGNGTVETALHALGLGAYDYLTKPYRMAEVDQLVRRAAEKRSLRMDAARLAWECGASNPVAPSSSYPPLRDALARAAESATEGRPPC